MELSSTDPMESIIIVKLVLSRYISVRILYYLSGLPKRTAMFISNGANDLMVQQN